MTEIDLKIDSYIRVFYYDYHEHYSDEHGGYLNCEQCGAFLGHSVFIYYSLNTNIKQLFNNVPVYKI